MPKWDHDLLNPAQAERVADWLATAPVLIADLSWGLDTTVLRVRAGQRDFIVKAGSRTNRHLGREITAHESYTAILVAAGRTGRMVAADRNVNVVLLEYLDGNLVEGCEAEFLPDTYRQAGSILRDLHSHTTRSDDQYEARATATASALAWLDREHGIEPEVERAARDILQALRPRPVDVVPTHGDWQPRNWLVHRGVITVIDFGRFDFRPAAADLCRLAAQQWRTVPSLEPAFLQGYGQDPRDPELWRIELLRQAVGTAGWAYRVGDSDFEAQGHRMLREALERF